jgi:hypothetical protein
LNSLFYFLPEGTAKYRFNHEAVFLMGKRVSEITGEYMMLQTSEGRIAKRKVGRICCRIVAGTMLIIEMT